MNIRGPRKAPEKVQASAGPSTAGNAHVFARPSDRNGQEPATTAQTGATESTDSPIGDAASQMAPGQNRGADSAGQSAAQWVKMDTNNGEPRASGSHVAMHMPPKLSTPSSDWATKASQNPALAPYFKPPGEQAVHPERDDLQLDEEMTSGRYSPIDQATERMLLETPAYELQGDSQPVPAAEPILEINAPDHDIEQMDGIETPSVSVNEQPPATSSGHSSREKKKKGKGSARDKSRQHSDSRNPATKASKSRKGNPPPSDTSESDEWLPPGK